ncbi:MAG TPA: hypothetical protein VJO12_14840 [Stellaceae bacterium]|nr:hypothetical protein [Stellaceae bacterium]
MKSAFPPMYRLTARGGVGLACDEHGIALGPVPLVEALAANSRRVFRPRPADEIARTLALAYGDLAPSDLTRCLSSLDVAAKALDAGDLAKASVAAVLLKLPDLSVDGFARLAADPSLKKYIPSQPRDDHGRWTSDGGGSAAVQVATNDDGTRTDAGGILPAPHRNNQTIATSFDHRDWRSVGEADSDHAITVNASDQIALETSSSAGPLPTNHFYFTVTAQPIDADGTPQPSLSTPEWERPVEYGSGPTGAGIPHQLVIQANPPGGMQRWTIKIPPQQSAHDNADYNMVRVYVRKPSPAN